MSRRKTIQLLEESREFNPSHEQMIILLERCLGDDEAENQRIHQLKEKLQEVEDEEK